MAHFAEIDESNEVLRVIVVNNSDCLKDGVEDEEKGAAFCCNLLGGAWIQTSYNSRIRKHYAGIGYTYDAARDAFIPPRPYASWTLGDDCNWQAPIPMPADNKRYWWDEENLSWKEEGME